MADRTPAHPHQPTLRKNPDDAPLPSERFRLSLIKGEHRWQFRWDPGCESQLIDRVARLAEQPDVPFDWYDAAVICRYVAQPFTKVSPRGDQPRPAA